jgi:CBS domain containing-hemolysin-like protein
MNGTADILGMIALYAALAAGMATSFMASAVETGSYRLNRIRLRVRANAGDRRAATLLGLLTDLPGLVVAILIINNAANYLVTAGTTILLSEKAIGLSDMMVQLVATAVVTPVLFVFCELLPKYLFAADPERFMSPLAGTVRGTYRLLYGLGLVPALKGVSRIVMRIAHKRRAEPFTPRQRLRAVLGEGAAEGVISGYQHELVGRVLGMREQLVSRVMIPIGSVAGVPLDITRHQFVEELRRHSYSRLPVWEGSREHVVGIVHINDVLAVKGDSMDLPALMRRDFVVVPPDMAVGQAMLALRKARAAMAIVSDAKGRAVGIITIKDLVEEIVGELAAW